MPGKTLTLSRRTFAIVLMDEALLLALLQRPFCKGPSRRQLSRRAAKRGKRRKKGQKNLKK
jgi:hypothetical protein